MAQFNLVTEPWIPVVDEDGSVHRVGLRDALLKSPHWRRFTGLSPVTEVALLRLLLAIAHRALQGPRSIREAAELVEAGQFPAEPVESYLATWYDRFDLFHPQYPFYQVPDLPGINPRPWTVLVHERASGNNPTLFDHTMEDAVPPATPAEAALALLTHQAFVPGGLIRRYGAQSGRGGPLAAAAAFTFQGRTLFETLALQLVPYDPASDLPIWEHGPFLLQHLEGGRAQMQLAGRTRIYTWMSRAVRLFPENDGTVRWIDYGPGVTPVEQVDLDPMCAYRAFNNRLEAFRLQQERAFWRDFDAVLPDPTGTRRLGVLEHAMQLLYELDRPTLLLPLAVTGQVTDQAKVLEIRREAYPLSPRVLEPDQQQGIREAVQRAAHMGDALQAAVRVAAAILLAPSGRAPDRRQVEELVRSLPGGATFWSLLYERFPAFLEQLSREGIASAREFWLQQLRCAAKDAWQQVVLALGRGPIHAKAAAEGERVLVRRMGEVLR